ncbi:MAG TPA: S8 family serine peptidase [Candidatus Angelobacter sp.]|nr:S8 family serine peptidase [Candidatus Angelobacter sp.]
MKIRHRPFTTTGFRAPLAVRSRARKRTHGNAIFILLLAILLGVPGYGQVQSKPAPEKHRILVKVRPELAQQIEAQLPAQGLAQAMAIRPDHSGSPGVQSFLTQYSPSRLAPLYPGLIRARQQHGWTDAEIADQLRQRFPRRAARQRPVATPEISRTYVMEFPGASAGEIALLVKRLKADPNVEFVEPDQTVRTSQLPNDPFLSSTGTWGQSYQDLWGHYKIGAPTAWNTTLGDSIIVAVVDTGIDYNHPDIAANVWINTQEIPNNGIDDDGNGFIDDVRGWDFIGANCGSPTQGNDPIDHFGHGTHVAGTIAAVGNNGIGIIGIAWHAQVMAVKGLDDSGCGLDSTLAPAIQYAAHNGADVINASWGGQGTSQTLEDAIQFAYSLGVVFVAAAGNSSEDALNFFPANSPEAITVAASDPFDGFANFSNFGSKIDVTAPGVDVLSLRAAGSLLGPIVDNDYTRLSGTSMATPHVAGTAALILSQHPTYAPEDVRQALRASASPIGTPGWDLQFGYGIVNATAALALPGVLEAHISSPAGGTHLTSAGVISGTAQGNGFDHYVLEYGTGLAPTAWVQIGTSSSPVVAGTLGTFDPTVVPDGVYTIRLTVFDAANRAFSDRVELIVDYVAITTPVPPAVPVTAVEFKTGAQIAISGTATGPSFKVFRLQWAEGIAPSTGWVARGITLTGGGASPISAGLLGTWDTTAISKADYYTIRLQVDDAGFTSESDTLVYIEPDLLSQNWPQSLNAAPYFGAGFLPFDDASGNPRLALVTPTYLFFNQQPQYVSFAPDGSSVSAVNIPQPSYLNPAVGSVDGSAPGNFAAAETTQIQLFHPDNTSFTFQKPTGFENYSMGAAQPVLEDVDGNSQLDVVELGDLIANGVVGPTAAIFAWRPDGTMLNSNFPLVIPDQNINLALGLLPRVLVGDIQKAGSKQFVVQEGVSSSQFTLGLFAHDGTPIPWAVPVFSGQPLSMVLADLDHNGALETLLVMFDTSLGQFMLHVFQPDGSERPGWPVTLSSAGEFCYMAVGDLNRDGTEEIVVTVQNVGLFVFEADGTAFPGAWPQGFVAGPVAIADIDGDGFPEILYSRYDLLFAQDPFLPNLATTSAAQASVNVQVNRDFQRGVVQPAATVTPATLRNTLYIAPALVALRRDATVARSWSLLGMGGNQPYIMPAITLGDFSGDGKTEIALNYFTVAGGGDSGFLNQGVALVLATGAPFNAAVNDWPMTYQSPHNTSVQRRALTIVVSSPSDGATVNGTVPITATVSGSVATVQFKIDGVDFGGPLATPPFTVSWDATKAAAGNHKLAALATDTSGRPIASATVTVNVVTNASSTAISLSTGSNPSTFGDSLTFTASVTPNTATGSATFFDGATAISGSVPLSGGSASFTTSLLGSGGHTITARYSGDSSLSNSTSAELQQHVDQATLTVTADNANRSYGAANPVFSGSVRGAVNGDSFTENFATSATPSSPVGTYSIVPSVTGADLANYTVAPVNGTLTVGKAASAGALASSNSSVNAGSAVTFTATVTSTTTGTPTGSVQFLDGVTPLSTAALNAQGVASFSTAALAGGTHAITAQYGGDGNFNGSTSALLSQNIMDFSPASSPSSGTVRAGGSAVFSFTVTPLGGFSQTVSFSCSGLPPEAQCSFAPPSVTPNGAPATSTLTITTTAPSASLVMPPGPRNQGPLYASLFALSGLVWIAAMGGAKRRSRNVRLIVSLMMLAAIAGLVSCGGGGGARVRDPGTPPGTSTISVTTSAGSTSHPLSVTLNVTN